MRQSLKTSVSSVDFRPRTAYDRHKNRMSMSREFGTNELANIRNFEKQIKDTEVHNGIHPGLPLKGEGGNELRFDLLINDLMPQDCYRVYQSDFNWKKGTQKKTLKEFEKQIYYSNGDYDAAYSLVQKRMLTGQHEIEKQLTREC